MPPKTKGKGKLGTGPSGSTTEIPPSVLTIMHPTTVEEFEKSFKTRLVMKPHVFNKDEVLSLHITNVCDILDAQQLGSFLNIREDYHENFIMAFYAGLETNKGWCFKVKIGTRRYVFEEID